MKHSNNSSLKQSSKAKYLLQASLISDDSNIPCVYEMVKPPENGPATVSSASRPITPGRMRTPSTIQVPTMKKKRTDAGLFVTELQWDLRLISSGQLTCTLIKDTSQEERFKSIKQQWETSQSGRLLRAKESRETFVKNLSFPLPRSQEADSHHHPLHQQQQLSNYAEWHEQKTLQFHQFQQELVKSRSEEHKRANAAREAQLEAIQRLVQETADLNRKVYDERAAYRRYIKDLETQRNTEKPAVYASIVLNEGSKADEGDPHGADSSKIKKKVVPPKK